MKFASDRTWVNDDEPKYGFEALGKMGTANVPARLASTEIAALAARRGDADQGRGRFTGMADDGADRDTTRAQPRPGTRVLRSQRDALGQAEAQAGSLKPCRDICFGRAGTPDGHRVLCSRRRNPPRDSQHRGRGRRNFHPAAIVSLPSRTPCPYANAIIETRSI
jgi:hypothetical protein